MRKILLSFFLGFLFALLLLREGNDRGGIAPTTVRDTVRTTVCDTITYHYLVPRDSVVVRYVVDTLPIADCKISPENSPDSLILQGIDSAAIVLPITQKTYHDSTYTAYISGYRPRLDSIRLYPRTHILTTSAPAPRWSIGVQAGYGFALGSTPRPAPYIGIGVQWRLLP